MQMADLPCCMLVLSIASKKGLENWLRKGLVVELVFLCYSSEQNASCNEKIQQET